MNRALNIASNASYVAAAFVVDDVFLSAALVALAVGSGLFHWQNNDKTLTLDRFGMLIVFCALLMPGAPWYAALFVAAICFYVATTGRPVSFTVVILGAVVVATRDTLISAVLGTFLIGWGYWLWYQDPEDNWWQFRGSPLHATWHILTAIAIVVLA